MPMKKPEKTPRDPSKCLACGEARHADPEKCPSAPK
jgi:hypothetical protein